MLIRTAYWVGRPAEGQDERFRAMVAGELVPAMRRFPGVAAVRSLWPEQRDEGAPGIHCQVVVEFADVRAREAMMSSAERKSLRPRVEAAAALFDGQLSHIDFVAE